MDINCGLVLDGELSVQQMGQRIFEQILRAASGEPTKSELLGLGDHEFVPWHLGIVSLIPPKRLRRLPQGAPLADRRSRIRGGRLVARIHASRLRFGA